MLRHRPGNHCWLEVEPRVLGLVIPTSFEEREHQAVGAPRSRHGTGQDFVDPTGKFQNHRRSTGFLQKVFVHGSMYLIKNFEKGGHG